LNRTGKETNMESMIMAALALAAQVAPLLTTSTQVASVINVIATAAPLAISAGAQIYGQVKAAIDAVQASAPLTPEQQAQLDAIEKQLDDDYDAASKAAAAEDAVAAAKQPGAG
jgi:hypothetical protein